MYEKLKNKEVRSIELKALINQIYTNPRTPVTLDLYNLSEGGSNKLTAQCVVAGMITLK